MSKIRLFATAALLVGTVALVGADKPAQSCVCPAVCSKQITKAYSVADLVVPVPGMTGSFPGMPPAQAKYEQQDGCCCLMAACCPEIAGVLPACEKSHEAELIKLITSKIKSGCWKCAGGDCTLEFSPVGMALVVHAPEETQKQVQSLIDSLRKYQDDNIVVEMRFITVPTEFFERFGLDMDMGPKPCPRVDREAKNGIEQTGFDDGCCRNADCKNRAVPISDVQTHLLLEAVQGDRKTCIMQAPKITMFNAQQSCLSVQDEQTFVTGVAVDASGEQTRVVPKNTTVKTGLKVSLLPLLSADRRFVSLHFQAEHTYPISPNATLIPVTTQITPVFEGGFMGEPIPFTQFIQQPKFRTLKSDSCFTIADGGTMLIDTGMMERDIRVEREVPVLGKLPYLNRLFRNVAYEHVSEHLLVMVTAKVICPEVEAKCTGSAKAGCGATAGCQSACCKAGPCDKPCSAGGCCATGTSQKGSCQSGCCEKPGCDKGCCEKGCCGKPSAKPAKVAVFEEESSVAPVPPAKVVGQAVRKSAVEQRAEKMAAKLVQKYHEACANGEPEKARRYGRQALDLDPECFGKTMIQQTYQKMPQPPEEKVQGLINQSDTGGQIRGEWQRIWFSDRPSHLTLERVKGGIQ